jgi:hypothetical protein
VRGLHPDERQELESIADTLANIVHASRDFAQLGKQTGGQETADKFRAVLDSAMESGKKAYHTLHDDYRKTSSITGRG